MIYLWFLRKVISILSYFLDFCYYHDKYSLYNRLYFFRLKVNKILVKSVLNKHFRELKK